MRSSLADPRHLSKPTEWTTARVNPCVNYDAATVHKRATATQNVKGKTCGGRPHQGASILDFLLSFSGNHKQL